MTHKINQFGNGRVKLMTTAALGIAIAGSGADRMTAYQSRQIPTEDQQSITAGNKFFCNTKALAPAERAHHKRCARSAGASAFVLQKNLFPAVMACWSS